MANAKTESRLRRVQRWVNGRFWRYTDFDGYDASAKTKDAPDSRQMEMGSPTDPA